MSPVRQGLIGQGRPDYGGDDFVEVGQPFDRVGKGLLVDLGVFRSDAVSDETVIYGGEFQFHGALPSMLPLENLC